MRTHPHRPLSMLHAVHAPAANIRAIPARCGVTTAPPVPFTTIRTGTRGPRSAIGARVVNSAPVMAPVSVKLVTRANSQRTMVRQPADFVLVANFKALEVPTPANRVPWAGSRRTKVVQSALRAPITLTFCMRRSRIQWRPNVVFALRVSWLTADQMNGAHSTRHTMQAQ